MDYSLKKSPKITHFLKHLSSGFLTSFVQHDYLGVRASRQPSLEVPSPPNSGLHYMQWGTLGDNIN